MVIQFNAKINSHINIKSQDMHKSYYVRTSSNISGCQFDRRLGLGCLEQTSAFLWMA